MSHTPGYEVTEDGRVFSTSSNWRGYGRREITQNLNSYGYPSVRIMVDGVRKHYSVHKLVALHYLPEKPSICHEIRHLDGNKLNNNATNLAWGTSKENAQDRDIHGKTSRGKKHSNAIKTSSHKEAVRSYFSRIKGGHQ